MLTQTAHLHWTYFFGATSIGGAEVIAYERLVKCYDNLSMLRKASDGIAINATWLFFAWLLVS